VHAGGIYAALKYIYKADRIVAEIDWSWTSIKINPAQLIVNVGGFL
jgi:hypothetical protein